MQFHISLPMRFRILGERVWHDAWANSMSSTEIVFHGEESMEIGKTLDIRVSLPQQSGSGRRGGTIVSKAKVTRSLPLSQNSQQSLIAAALTGARLLRSNPENGISGVGGSKNGWESVKARAKLE